MHIKSIEERAEAILKGTGIVSAPIPIEDLAQMENLRIRRYDLGENVSGVLIIQNGIGTIGVNPNDSPLRQRFTIAHELGHYVLHRGDSDLFIDKGFKVHFRDGKSSKGEEKKEIEANAFAAAILMPHRLLISQIKSANIDLADDEAIKKLAQKFGVSPMAMTYRISNLNLF